MSEMAKSAREAMKAKARRMADGHNEKVDASDIPADYTFEGGKPTYPIMPKPRAYADGGAVAGYACGGHAGKKPRVGNKGNYEGGTRPTGGRIARKHGGKTGKGKTNINIIIGAGGHRDQQQAPATVMPPSPPVAIRPPGMMPPGPPGGMPGMPPGAAPPPMGAMPRKSGGRAKSYKDMTAGAGSGPGRLEKCEIEESK